jgi:hypothetical protein
MNISYTLLKIFFEKIPNHNVDNLLAYVDEIDILYSVTNNTINFQKFEVINSDSAKEIINNLTDKDNSKDFNIITKLFFIIHNIMFYFVKALDEQYTKSAQQLSELFRANMLGDPKT